MKITKYPQSCLLIEKGDGRILIDPGTLAMNAHSLDEFGEVHAVLYTHRHADHFDESYVERLLDRGVELYGNSDVCSVIGDGSNEVKDGQSFDLFGFSISPRDLPHCPMVDGSAGPPNTGFVIDERLFHSGDGMELPGLKAELLALPIAGPSISFRDAYVFAEQTEASTVIPVHYDFFVADPELFSGYCDIAETIVLANGESVEV